MTVFFVIMFYFFHNLNYLLYASSNNSNSISRLGYLVRNDLVFNVINFTAQYILLCRGKF